MSHDNPHIARFLEISRAALGVDAGVARHCSGAPATRFARRRNGECMTRELISRTDRYLPRFLRIAGALGVFAAVSDVPERCSLLALNLTDTQRDTVLRVLRKHLPLLRTERNALADARAALKTLCGRPRVTSIELNAAADAITAAHETLDHARAAVIRELRSGLTPYQRIQLEAIEDVGPSFTWSRGR